MSPVGAPRRPAMQVGDPPHENPNCASLTRGFKPQDLSRTLYNKKSFESSVRQRFKPNARKSIWDPINLPVERLNLAAQKAVVAQRAGRGALARHRDGQYSLIDCSAQQLVRVGGAVAAARNALAASRRARFAQLGLVDGAVGIIMAPGGAWSWLWPSR
jgi:hypothetical protein